MQLSALKSKTVLFMGVGSTAFWLPDLIVHAIAGSNFDKRQLWVVTAISPISLLVTYIILRPRAELSGLRHVGVAMLCGVWLLGGVFMFAASSFAGSGFARLDSGSMLLLLCSFLPPVTCMMATYDGSLFALLGATLAAVVILVVRMPGVEATNEAAK